MRLFTAIELPDPVRQHLAGIAGELEEAWPSFDLAAPAEGGYSLSFVRPENLHVTLKFLGEVPEGRLPVLSDALGRLAARPASPVHADRVELFPPRGPVRVLAVGLGGDVSAVNSLFEAVEDCCAELGFAREGRGYRAHVTLARARKPLPKSARAGIEGLWGRRLPGPEFDVTEFVLMESHLKPTGPEYVPLARFPLNRPAAAS